MRKGIIALVFLSMIGTAFADTAQIQRSNSGGSAMAATIKVKKSETEMQMADKADAESKKAMMNMKKAEGAAKKKTVQMSNSGGSAMTKTIEIK